MNAAQKNLYSEHKTALTPAERLRVAVAILVWGWDQHRVAALMDVNQGRVNEAVSAVRRAIEAEEHTGPSAAAEREREAWRQDIINKGGNPDDPTRMGLGREPREAA